MTPGIATLLRVMPEGYDNACFETGAIVRKRDIKDPDDLMMLALFHLLTGCSLIEISEVAKLAEIGNISDVAFMKRFKKCNEWFKWIISNTISDGLIEYTPPKKLTHYRILAVDASDVKEKGRSSRVFRLHFALDLIKMQAALYNITSNHVGEKLANFDFQEGDLVLGDRVYSSVAGIEHCLASGSDYVLRVKLNSFKPYDSDGNPLDLYEIVVGSGLDVGEKNVFLKCGDGRLLPSRICYRKIDDAAIKNAYKRMKKREHKHQMTMSDNAKAFNEYIIVVSSLPKEISTDDVLELYRFRWQVELYFKRLKSILDFGELPKKTEESIFTWLNGKMMIALLIEKIMSEASFPPTGESFEEYLARDEDDEVAAYDKCV